MSDATDLNPEVGALTGDQAASVLALVPQLHGHSAGPFTWPEIDHHLHEAWAQPDIQALADRNDNYHPADLARATLIYLSDTGPSTRDLITQGSHPALLSERFDPTGDISHRCAGSSRLPLRHQPRSQPRQRQDINFRMKPLPNTHDRQDPQPVLQRLPVTYLSAKRRTG